MATTSQRQLRRLFMLKGNGLLRNFLDKHFEEKYEHTKVALNFCSKILYVLILVH